MFPQQFKYAHNSNYSRSQTIMYTRNHRSSHTYLPLKHKRNFTMMFTHQQSTKARLASRAQSPCCIHSNAQKITHSHNVHTTFTHKYRSPSGDPLSLCFKHKICVHESARVRPLREVPAHLLIARALHRNHDDDDGGPGSLGTLTCGTCSGFAFVSAAGCCCSNERAPHGSLRSCRSAVTLAPMLAIIAATTLAALLVACQIFSMPDLSAHCSRLAAIQAVIF
jgi:hypothetical protein